MKVMNISKNRFQELERYQLPSSVFNSEARMYVTSGPMFGNKLQTINALTDLQEEIDIPEIVFPEKLAVVNAEVVGYIMELVESVNLETILSSYDVDAKTKIKYLHQIGAILEKMKKARKYTNVKDFYLNDMHEHNFIVDLKTDNVRVVDIDSCKINGNYTFGSRYLSPMSMVANIGKYKHEENGICGGYLVPSEDTELYCYTIMILNTLYGGGFNRVKLEEFYNYIEYLYSLGASIEIIDMFEKIVSNHHNENPYELLECLIPIMPKSRRQVYERIRKK